MADAGTMSTIARQFVDAFNRRDADGLVALVDPALEWHPSVLVGGRRTYRGHAGLRQWVSDLARAPVHHQARVRDVEVLEENRFLVLSEVLVDGEPMTPQRWSRGSARTASSSRDAHT
jgi:phage terminase large subunit-like protein